MSIIDKQRIAAAATLETLGYSFSLAEGWSPPEIPSSAVALDFVAEADAMHALLVLRADKMKGCTEGSDEATELGLITNAVGAYEAKRWPNGKEASGKG